MFGCSFANTFPLSAPTTTIQIIVCEISDPFCIYQEPSFKQQSTRVVCEFAATVFSAIAIAYLKMYVTSMPPYVIMWKRMIWGPLQFGLAAPDEGFFFRVSNSNNKIFSLVLHIYLLYYIC